MVSVLLARVFNCKIIDDKNERDWLRLLQPEIRGCGVIGNIQMVLNEFAVIEWRVIPLVSNRTCLFEFRCIPNRRRLMR
jgi:hypothetical protein